MIVQGIVSEYNPFHNGHLHHIAASATATGADATVCVMSGNFVQRGEPAAFSKWARAEMALRSGADLVLELPAAYACASAEAFATGAVSILEATGLVDFLCFGSETGEIEPLDMAARVLADEPEDFRLLLRQGLDKGLSFAVARQKALAAWAAGQTGKSGNPFIGQDATAPENAEGSSLSIRKPDYDASAFTDTISAPNDILGVEYLKALRRIGSRMQPFTLRRLGRGYNDPILEGAFPSATALRKAMAEGGTPDDAAAANGMPETTLAVLRREMAAGRGPVTADHFLPVLLQRLRTATDAELTGLPWMEQGLHHRLRAAASDAATWDALVGSAACSRYPRTRIQRMLCALLIGLPGTLPAALSSAGNVQYLRILGFNEVGRELLAIMRRRASVPIIGRSASWGIYRDPLIQALLALECRATDTWTLACREPVDRRAGWEHRAGPVILPLPQPRET